MIELLDVVFYTSIFVLPGFIILGIVNSANPFKEKRESLIFLKFIMYCIVSCAIGSWLYKLIIEYEKIGFSRYWALLIAISFFGAIIIGVILAKIKQNQITNKILSKFKIKTIHSVPTAWNYCFFKKELSFIIITLIDDTKLYD